MSIKFKNVLGMTAELKLVCVKPDYHVYSTNENVFQWKQELLTFCMKRFTRSMSQIQFLNISSCYNFVVSFSKCFQSYFFIYFFKVTSLFLVEKMKKKFLYFHCCLRFFDLMLL